MRQITLAVPVSMIAQANALLGTVAYSEADAFTFAGPTHLDGEGREYAVASGVLHDAVIDRLTAPLVAPAWPVDVALAADAQALVAMWDAPEDGEAAPPFAAPDRIAVVLDQEAMAARAALGVVPIPPPVEDNPEDNPED